MKGLAGLAQSLLMCPREHNSGSGNSRPTGGGGQSTKPVASTGDDPIATTLAIGEEDGGCPPGAGAGGKPPSGDDPIMTTMAVGEEDGGLPPGGIGKPDDPIATTKAMGEEDGGLPPVAIKPPPGGGPIYTTLAIGEEDGGLQMK
ncbi:MAG: hypothetical protein ACFCUJ_16215 [Thiotrichales bacterium]